MESMPSHSGHMTSGIVLHQVDIYEYINQLLLLISSANMHPNESLEPVHQSSI